jgi:ABC-type Fe3+ transport system substrate-binding protein
MMLRRLIPLLLLLAAVIAAPIVLRQESALATAGQGDDRLVIITPHNETIRSEFGEAFARYWKTKTGRSLYIDWRVPGGTSDIKRVVNSAYTAAEALHNPGIGIDLFFGGGEPDFNDQSKAGHLAELEVFTTHPEWFKEEVIPSHFTGERYYDPARLWVGACLSQMGICYNTDSLQRMGLRAPKRWDDLGSPAYAGYVALADPTKSGSVNRTYELMIQQQMQEVIREQGDTPAAREEGWKRGLNLLQRLAANARYFTDSAAKVAQDVSQGDAIAGNCIDFYGRTYQEKLERQGKPSRLRWIAPEGGTSLSADPIAMLRGAPHPEIAQAFVTFCLSTEGQLLWDLKVGAPGGPHEASPRRLPIRRDLYTAAYLPGFADADAMPYASAGGLEYRKDLTGSAFSAISAIFRAMCMDPQDELKDAWKKIHAPGANAGPAEAALFDISHVSYARVMSEFVPLLSKKDPLANSREIARISAVFRANYLRAAELATQGGGRP